jgi:predicted dehydrogenase
MAQDDDRKIGYCPVGLGRVSDNFLRASKASKHARITGLVSGHRDKAEKIAAEYGVPAKNIYSYDNYDAIADNKEIDAIYIGLPNSMHAEYTIRAAKAGKHVLCEKPMANTPTDCQAMIDACRKGGKKLMLAYRCQYEPVVNLRAVELIRSGKLGKIQTIDTASGFNIRPGEWRLDGKLAGGGPLMDMGIYALNGCRYLTGEEPVEVKGVASVIAQASWPIALRPTGPIWAHSFASTGRRACSWASRRGGMRASGWWRAFRANSRLTSPIPNDIPPNSCGRRTTSRSASFRTRSLRRRAKRDFGI